MPFKYSPVELEYQRHEKLKKDHVKILQNWMSKQEHLPKINELKTIFFLQSCGFNLEPAKVCIENFFTIQSQCPEFFQNRTFDSIKDVLDGLLITVLPKQTENQCSVTLIKLLDSNSDRFDFVNYVKAVDMVVTLNLMINGTAKGQIMILDMDKVHMSHLFKLNLTAMKKYMIYLQEGVHARIKGIHIVNTSPLTDKLLSLVKPLIKSELFESIQTHTKLNTLYKYVAQDILPEEYGGKEMSIYKLKEDIIKMVRENEEYFKEESQQVLDETKRKGLPVDIQGIFGIEGSFKKLEID